MARRDNSPKQNKGNVRKSDSVRKDFADNAYSNGKRSGKKEDTGRAKSAKRSAARGTEGKKRAFGGSDSGKRQEASDFHKKRSGVVPSGNRNDSTVKKYIPREKRYATETGLSAGDWNLRVSVSVETEEQLDAVLHHEGVNLIYIDEACFGIRETAKGGSSAESSAVKGDDAESEAFAKIIENIHKVGKKAGLRLRRIERDTDSGLDSANLIKKLIDRDAAPDALLIRSFDEAMMVSELENSETGNKGLNHIGRIFDYTCYGYNKEAVSMLRDLGAEKLTYPIELTYRECLNLRASVRAASEEGDTSEIPYEMLVYGHLPMMVSANCIQRTSDRCDHQNRFLVLRDRMQKNMPVRCYCKYCYNQIFNAEPLLLYDLEDEIRRLEPESVRYDFSVESGEEVLKILSGAIPENMTRGHFRHGIE